MSILCETCGGYKGMVHRCPPRWTCWIPYFDEDGDIDDYHGGKHSVHATDAEEAAEKYAERHDMEGDYTIVGGQEVVVHVRDGDGKIIRCKVRGETRAVYSAVVQEGEA